MHIAIFEADGRTNATVASLVMVDALHALGLPVVLARISTGLPLLEPLAAAGIEVFETVVADEARDLVARARVRAIALSAHLVLDLPLAAAADIAGLDVRILAVGPFAIDVAAAMSSLRRDFTRHWRILGCCRGNAKVDAAALQLSFLGQAGTAPDVLPTSLPRPTEGEGADLLLGRISSRMLRSGIALLQDLGAIDLTDEAMSTVSAQSDTRNGPDRLRNLADAIESAMDGTRPMEEELARAPRLENWHRGLRPVPVLIGTVSGHPNIASGRPVVTSEIHLTDGKTWARTLSRLYALGRKVDEPPGPIRH